MLAEFLARAGEYVQHSPHLAVLAVFVGFEVITKVPPTLHTPLMSGSNAISGITIVGALIVAGQTPWREDWLIGIIAFGSSDGAVIEALDVLRDKGIRCAVIKHSHHDFEIDKEGKDSHKLRKAGAWLTALTTWFGITPGLAPPEYGIPDHAVAGGATFAPADSAAFTAAFRRQ